MVTKRELCLAAKSKSDKLSFSTNHVSERVPRMIIVGSITTHCHLTSTQNPFLDHHRGIHISERHFAAVSTGFSIDLLSLIGTPSASYTTQLRCFMLSK